MQVPHQQWARIASIYTALWAAAVTAVGLVWGF